MASAKKLRKRAHKAQVATMQRHMLVCTDGDCGGKKVAKSLRKAVAKAGLRSTVTVTKVDCLNICKGGTVAVVYPEGTWYGNVDDTDAQRIVDEHLSDGKVVDELVFMTNGLDPDRADCLADCQD